MAPGRSYGLRTSVRVLSGEPGVQLRAMQYDATGRIRHDAREATGPRPVLRFESAEAARSLRVALSFSGSGQVEIAPLELVRL